MSGHDALATRIARIEMDEAISLESVDLTMSAGPCSDAWRVRVRDESWHRSPRPRRVHTVTAQASISIEPKGPHPETVEPYSYRHGVH
jgi:hypothetical protein